jgi:hypothetical protein
MQSWDVALDGRGNATIVWVHDGQAVKVRSWAAGDDEPARAVVVAAPTPPLGASDAVVESNAAGDLVLGWGRAYQDDSRVEVVFGPAGGAWGAVETVTDVAPADTNLSDVAMQEDGTARVAWVARTPDDTSSVLIRSRAAP